MLTDVAGDRLQPLRRPLGRVVRFARRTIRDPHRRRQEIEAALAARPVDALVAGPLVSVLIATHNGLAHLQRLLPALERSAYTDIEVIVVDNASTDGTAAYLARPWRMDVRVIPNDANESFSLANNQAAAIASGSLLLFLNNDVEPAVDTWLGSMVRALEDDPSRVAAGAVLIYPGHGHRRDFTVQHRGIDLVLRDGALVGVNVGGRDPLDPALDATVDVVAATAAVLLVRADAFRAVGGFDATYEYGAEDVDVCLRLAAVGRIVVVGQAKLFHDESATLRQQDRVARRAARQENWRHFAEVWGPSMVRRLRQAHLAGSDLAGTARRPKVAITVTRDDPALGGADYDTAHDLGDALAGLGWDVVYIERFREGWYRLGTADVVVALFDSYDVRRAPSEAITVAWVRNWVDRWVGRPWFEHVDTVLCGSADAAAEITARSRHQPHVVPLEANPASDEPSEQRRKVLERGTSAAFARRLVECVDEDLRRPSVAVRIGAPTEQVLERWGDTHLARALAASLGPHGFATRLQLRPQWDDPRSQNVDAVIHLRGLGRCAPNPRHVNILWIISHPDEVTVAECDDYDVVLVASKLMADQLNGATTADVLYLPQATDARRFHPTQPDPAAAHELLFVGNSRHAPRHGVAWAQAAGLPLTVFGSGWEGRIPPALVRDTYYPNEDLGRLYASAKVVLNDHWPDMARMGFVSNRVFDVLGAGGVVVSDPVPGMEELFGDLVPTYSSAAELEALVGDLLADEPRRREISRRGAALVAAQHTMDQRGEVIAGLLHAGLARRIDGVRTAVTPPSPT